MPDLLIISFETNSLAELQTNLVRNGFNCSMTCYGDDIAEYIFQQSPDIILAEVSVSQSTKLTWGYIHEIKLRNPLPVIGLLTGEISDEFEINREIDDFIISPFNLKELSLRIKRILAEEVTIDDGEIIKYNGLLIDLARCQVSVDGKKTELTFKEYELLKLLAENSGRVFTRSTLLDKIWGIDYFGGDRTVDVHVRRLRSKIEKSGKIFIETVRNIGYRFRND